MKNCQDAKDTSAREEKGSSTPRGILTSDQFQTIHEGYTGRSTQRETDPIEWPDLVFTGIWDPQRGQCCGKHAQRDVQEENPVPGSIGGNKATDRRADNGSDKPRPSDVSDGVN